MTLRDHFYITFSNDYIGLENEWVDLLEDGCVQESRMSNVLDGLYFPVML